MKKLLILVLLLLISVPVLQAQKLSIDFARDSIQSINQAFVGGKWVVRVKCYKGIVDTVNSYKEYQIFTIQQETKLLSDSVLNSLTLRMQQERGNFGIKRGRSEARKLRLAQEGKNNLKLQARINRNLAKIDSIP